MLAVHNDSEHEGQLGGILGERLNEAQKPEVVNQANSNVLLLFRSTAQVTQRDLRHTGKPAIVKHKFKKNYLTRLYQSHKGLYHIWLD